MHPQRRGRPMGRVVRKSGAKAITMVLLAAAIAMTASEQILAEPVDSKAGSISDNESWFQQRVKRFRSYPRLDRAYRLLEQGRLKEALKEIETYLTIRPEDNSVRLLFATVLYRTGQFTESIRESNRILEGPSALPAAQLNRALALQATAQPEAATEDFRAVMLNRSAERTDRTFAASSYVEIACLRDKHQACLEGLDQLVQLNPEAGRNFDLLQRRANALLALGRTRSAEDSLRAAADLAHSGDERLQILKVLALLAQLRGDIGAQKTSLTSALAIDPNDVSMMRRMAEIERQAGDLVKATEWISKSLTLKSNAADREFLAELLRQQNDFDGVIEQTSRLLSQQKQPQARARLLMSRGFAYHAMRRFSEAAADFREALALHGDESAQTALLNTLETAGERAQAIELLERFVTAQPKSAWLVRLANHYEANGAYVRAADTLRLATRSSTDLHKRAGYLYLQAGDAINAVAEFEQVLNLRDDASVEYSLAVLYGKLGSDAQVRAALEHSLRSGLAGGERVEALRLLGHVHERNGRHEQAASTFQSALEAGGEHLETRRALAFSLYRSRRWEAAHAQFDAIARRTGSAEALLQAGLCKRQMRAADEALVYLIRASAKADNLEPPQRKQLYDEMGLLYREHGDLPAAAGSWNRSLKVQPDVAIALHVAAAERAQKHLDAAEAALKSVSAVKVQKEVEAAQTDEWANLAYAYKNAGRLDAALRSFEAALAQQPGRTDLQQDLADTYLEAGDYVHACAYFRQIAKRSQNAVALTRAEECQRQLNGDSMVPRDEEQSRSSTDNHFARNSPVTELLIYAQLDTGTMTDAGHVDAVGSERLLLAAKSNASRNTASAEVESPPQASIEAMGFDENANASAARGDFVAAIAALEKADKLQPTAERQYRLGEWSQKLGRTDDALRHFELARNRDPGTILYAETLAYAYKNAARLDDAARAFNEALKLQADRTDLRRNLAYTYWEAKNLPAACREFDAIAKRSGSAEALLEAGSCNRQMKQSDEALSYWVRASAKADSLDVAQRKQLYDEMGYLYHERGDLPAAIAAWNRSLQVQPDVSIALHVAAAEREQKNLDAAEATLKSVAAVKVAKEVETARADEWANLAYAYKNAGRQDAAIRCFEAALAQQPGRADLQQDLAYTYLQTGDGTNAARVFKNAIDAKSAASGSAEESKAAAQSIEGMRREVSELEKRQTFSFYESYRARRGASLGTGTPGVGVLPSQGAAEYDYRITDSGNPHPVQAFARVLWGSSAGSLSADNDSLQGGIGLRYKPVAQQDFYVSAEKQIKIGDNAEDDWLLRASYGWSSGYEMRYDVPSWNTFTFYGDLGYFTGPDIWAAYAEIREGRTFRVANNMMLMPHVTVSGLAQSPDPYDGSYSEAGVGVSLRYLFNESYYSAPRSSAEFLLQYKKGLSPSIPWGWVATMVLLF